MYHYEKDQSKLTGGRCLLKLGQTIEDCQVCVRCLECDVHYLWQQCGVVLQKQQEQVIVVELVQCALSQ